jgi:hypothetical protein
MRVAKKDVARLKNFLTYSAHILNGAAKQAQAIANVVSRKVRARIVSWAKRHTLPGFDKLPLYAVWLVFQQHSERNMLNIRSRAIAFSFMLAIFPSIIFLFSLLPYIPIKNFDTTMFKFLNEVLPPQCLRPTIQHHLRPHDHPTRRRTIIRFLPHHLFLLQRSFYPPASLRPRRPPTIQKTHPPPTAHHLPSNSSSSSLGYSSYPSS